ncbi:hypothetical protein HBH64_051450 [Parastagonospora nodorum]|nr:hypothetical protein HBH52_144210 [Parastagonospora nodorum]KAH3980776.1 hypothetical protein HBH51_050130 [Parastagonospora nodorum]KAH4302821.1 hypothetical protein HBI01_091650 [Parastagonospora nodorum]KAH4312196.1 hypothetical protein HBI02_087560 [Parastagonospora nodorum]KAH4331211.1 hypothetical protein HBI00_072790 [Parastagonospora nodorum]
MDDHHGCNIGCLLSYFVLGRTHTPSALIDEEKVNLHTQERKHIPYYGNKVPLEASIAPEDSETWYAAFFDLAWCAPHRDGKHIIVCVEWFDDDNGRELNGWPAVKLRNAYERLGEEHKRVVSYAETLADGNVVIERLWPGVFNFQLPAMEVPVPETQTSNDRVMLSLYYRWALQGLSALNFAHSRSVFLRAFCAQMVWVRSDYSLALTGFIGADIVGDKTDYREGGSACDEDVELDDSAYGSVKDDLFRWATFVWRLMTNDFTERSPSAQTYCWGPCCPVEGGCRRFTNDGHKTLNRDHRPWLQDRQKRKMFQELEEARLGSVLLKAWNAGYESMDEVMADVRLTANRMGVDIHEDEDEVEVDARWEDVFEMVEMVQSSPGSPTQRLRFKELSLV